MPAVVDLKTYRCNNCGATTDFSVNVDVVKCAFCGSEQIIEGVAAPGRLRPQTVIGFAVEEPRALSLYQEWLGKGFFRPRDLTAKASLQELKGVYVPFWRVSGRARSHWTADAGYNETRTVGSGDDRRTETTTRWQPARGHHEGYYSDVLVPASGAIDQSWADQLAPWDWSAARAYQPEFLLGKAAEEAQLSETQGVEAARQVIERREHTECERQVPGDTNRNLHVNTTLDEVRYELVFLPIWIAAFIYEGKTYRCLVNGQTAKVSGKAPVAASRVLMVVGAVVAVILVIVLLVALLG